MKIKKIILENVKSFRDKTEIEFNDGLNIFIGPNAGGKSNLMDIINILLGYHFIYPWRLNKSNNPNGTITRQIINQRDQVFSSINQLLERHKEYFNKDLNITISFIIHNEDILNLEIIKSNKDKLIELEKNNFQNNIFETLFDKSQIFNKDSSFPLNTEQAYQILNHNLPSLNDNIAKEFLNYLNNFELFSILINEYNNLTKEDKIQDLFPLLLYFSPYRVPSIRDLNVQISGENKFDIMEAYKRNTSKDVSSTLRYSNFYFASMLRNYNDDLEIFKDDKQVKSLLKYIEKLGYESFDYVPTDKQTNTYKIVLKKLGKEYDLLKASSGEKEVINMLSGIFSFNIHNGIVVIDEPDLHLHPQWQKILIEMFNELAEDRKIQFFITTHSPHFITIETINNTFRVYKENDTSKVFSFKKEYHKKGNIKDIFQVVNSLNNEKIFFADKIILVEGYVDRIIFGKILEIMQKSEDINEVIEIIEVYGKDNFKKFKDFLKSLEIKNYIIADLDYLSNIENDEIKNILKTNNDKLKKSLEDKNSKDAMALLRSLDNIVNKTKEEIADEDISDLKGLFDYIKSRHINMKYIDQNNEKTISTFIEDKYNVNIFILKGGEIEDYFGSGHFDISEAIQTANNLNSIDKIPEEIKTIFNKILND